MRRKAHRRQQSPIPAPDHSAGSRAGLAEFALYDCAACHHELVIPSARQQRGYGGFAPGRPRFGSWALPLARAGAELAKPPTRPEARSALGALLVPLAAATAQAPFGEPAAVGPAARQAIRQLDALIDSLDALNLDAATARRFLTLLCRSGSRTLLDRDSARHLAAAIGVIVADLADSAGSATPLDAKSLALARELAQSVDPLSAPARPAGAVAGHTASVDRQAGFSAARFQAKLRQLIAALDAK